MTRTVFCTKYQADMEAMDRPPYPGAKGQTYLKPCQNRHGKIG